MNKNLVLAKMGYFGADKVIFTPLEPWVFDPKIPPHYEPHEPDNLLENGFLGRPVRVNRVWLSAMVLQSTNKASNSS